MSAILALETGHVFYGNSIGVTGIRVGEVIFNTALTGYQEIITDPSYAQQIINFTYPHIGNTGINFEDSQSACIYAAGIIIKNISNFYSNWRAIISLHEFLIQNQVVGISGVDTRMLTKLLRSNGSLRGCIMAGSIDKNVALQKAKEFHCVSGIELIKNISTNSKYVLNEDKKFNVVLLDFGVKKNIINCLTALDCKVIVVPADTDYKKIINLNPDGILLSNGPGDPQDCNEITENVKKLLDADIPMLGICFGHQLLALALGATTYKMDFGHHGANHPVQNLHTKQVLISSQNHNFAVDEVSLGTDIIVTHRSLFDKTIQGFKHKYKTIFGFQGHPEAAPGPHDAINLFDEFIVAMRKIKCQKELI